MRSKRQNKLLEELREKKLLVCDGAWGTMLINRGLSTGECPEMWCLKHSDRVRAIAQEYILAGARIIETNSFGANPFKLAHYGFENQLAEINEQAAILSREAAGTENYVMGSVGPTGKILMMEDISETELYDGFARQMVALQKGTADAVCIETMSAIDEASIAIRAAKDNTDLIVICSFTFEKILDGNYRTMMGVSPLQMAEAVVAAGADVVGSNCGNGSLGMIEIVRAIRSAVNVPILVRANAGIPQMENRTVIYPETPGQMAENVAALIVAGANIIGGCCGTTPAHIQRIAQQVKSYRGNNVSIG